jgi:hypothetical protein
MRTAPKHYNPLNLGRKAPTFKVSQLEKYLDLKATCPFLEPYSNACTCKFNRFKVQRGKHKPCNMVICPFRHNEYVIYYGAIKELEGKSV